VVANRRTPRTGPPREPVLPAGLPAASAAQRDVEHEQTVAAAAYDGADLANRLAERVEFAQCRFRKATFASSHLPAVRFTDCLVETSDLSNLQAEKGTLERVRLAGCRMTGVAWNDGLLRDAVFTDCKVDLTNWRFARFDAVSFDNCNLSGADFTEADLRGARFTGCDLSRAQFHHAKMAGARFRTCELQGIGGIMSWDGAIVHPDDLLALSYLLAGALGIAVRETDH
jgi:uncharacterized protein YjbI with pentapeptide repeats